MLLKDKQTQHLVEVEDLISLCNPFEKTVDACSNYGEEKQDPEPFSKLNLMFPSGEALPQCWVEPHFRDDELKRR